MLSKIIFFELSVYWSLHMDTETARNLFPTPLSDPGR